MTELTCFKAYDIRGEINVNIDEQIVYSVGRAVAQHFDAKSIIVGFDARETSHRMQKRLRVVLLTLVQSFKCWFSRY